jgi:hypothetical protein
MFRVTPRVVIYPQVFSRALSYSAEILINILRVVSIVPLADSSRCLEVSYAVTRLLRCLQS